MGPIRSPTLSEYHIKSRGIVTGCIKICYYLQRQLHEDGINSNEYGLGK